jgi:hypothetical protein
MPRGEENQRRTDAQGGAGSDTSEPAVSVVHGSVGRPSSDGAHGVTRPTLSCSHRQVIPQSRNGLQGPGFFIPGGEPPFMAAPPKFSAEHQRGAAVSARPAAAGPIAKRQFELPTHPGSTCVSAAAGLRHSRAPKRTPLRCAIAFPAINDSFST